MRVVRTSQDEQAGSQVKHLRDFAAEARAAVLEARNEAARIVAEAHDKSEQIARQAEQRGHAEGLARGRQDGYAQGRRDALAEGRRMDAQACDELGALLRHATEEVSAGREALFEQAKRELLDMALEIAAMIVGRRAAGDVEVARGNLARALDLAADAATLKVRVNEDQFEDLEETCGELLSELHVRGDVTLVGDERIERGGVEVITPAGLIDATIETQLENVVAALLGRQADAAAAWNRGEGDA